MVSIAQTSRKYHGRKAATYDSVRQKQRRWKIENAEVERMLTEIRPRSVIDVPCGTGRFFGLYAKLNVAAVRGVDASEEMLALARKKLPRTAVGAIGFTLERGDATSLPRDTWQTAVCVRFLDLIDEEAMRKVVTELCRVAKSSVILTIRFGPKYVPKVNTAEHAEKAFFRLVRSLGWECVESVPVLNAGWHIVRLGR